MAWRLVRVAQRQATRRGRDAQSLVFCLNPAPYPELAELDRFYLGYITLDPSSLGDPIPGDAGASWRHRLSREGLGSLASVWRRSEALQLQLTEFPDPAGLHHLLPATR